MAARGRILRCVLSNFLYRSIRLTLTMRLVDSHNALVKKSRRATRRYVRPTTDVVVCPAPFYNPRLRVTRLGL